MMNKKAEGKQSPTPALRFIKATPSTSVQNSVQNFIQKLNSTQIAPNTTPPVPASTTPPLPEGSDSEDTKNQKDLIRSSTFNLSDISDDDTSHSEKCEELERKIKNLEADIATSNAIREQQDRILEKLKTDLQQANHALVESKEVNSSLIKQGDALRSRFSELDNEKNELLLEVTRLRNSIESLRVSEVTLPAPKITPPNGVETNGVSQNPPHPPTTLDQPNSDDKQNAQNHSTISTNQPQNNQNHSPISTNQPQNNQNQSQNYQNQPQNYQNQPQNYQNQPQNNQNQPQNNQNQPQNNQNQPQNNQNQPQHIQNQPQNNQNQPQHIQNQPQYTQNQPQYTQNQPPNPHRESQINHDYSQNNHNYPAPNHNQPQNYQHQPQSYHNLPQIYHTQSQNNQNQPHPEHYQPPTQNGHNADTSHTEKFTTIPKRRNTTSPRPSYTFTHSNYSSPTHDNSKIGVSYNNHSFNASSYLSYANSRKSPSISQSKDTLHNLQGLLSDMIKTAVDQKSNVEILLSNIDVTLSQATPSATNLHERPMTPEETVYFRNEKKTLERELSRLDGVISDLREQKLRCDQKLDRVKQRIEEAEAKQRPSSATPPPSESPVSNPSSSYPSPSHPSSYHSPSHPSSYPSPSRPSYMEVRDLSPTRALDSSGKVASSPTRTMSPYFYYGSWGSQDKIDLSPPPDRNSPSHRLTSGHIQKFNPQFIPDAQKLKTFPKNMPASSSDKELRPSSPKEDASMQRTPFEWNYYFSSRS